MVKNAAFIGRVLRMDPVTVIAERDPLRYAVRWAAAELLVEADQAAQQKARKGR